ncbi:MAG: hypothetical protein MUE63_15105 [Xanthomonadales bacterium]|jgi:hypothetical protein|nr:hypothetical protein [Xanthomonadales bacterium]
MNAHRLFRLAVQVGLAGLVGSAMAAGPLSKAEVITLLSGSKATQRFTDPSTQGSALVEYGADGRYTNTRTGPRYRGTVETGTWRVNDNGQLCVTLEGKTEPRCNYLVPKPGGAYELTQDPATSGKVQITAVSK